MGEKGKLLGSPNCIFIPVRFACSMLTTVGGLGVQRAQSRILRWCSIFSQLNSIFKICSFEAFLVPTKGNPQNHWFNSICKKCNNPRSGHRESCFGSETVDLFHVNEFQSRDNKWKQPEPDCRKCCDMKIMVNLFPLVGAMYSPVPC